MIYYIHTKVYIHPIPCKISFITGCVHKFFFTIGSLYNFLTNYYYFYNYKSKRTSFRLLDHGDRKSRYTVLDDLDSVSTR